MRLNLKLKNNTVSPVTVFVFFIIYLVYTALFNHNFPPCSRSERKISIPAEYENSTISFKENRALRMNGIADKNVFGNCTDIWKNSKNYIFSIDNEQQINNPRIDIISNDEEFKLVKAVVIKCDTLPCIDSSKSSLFVLLKDEQGTGWVVPHHALTKIWYTESAVERTKHFDNNAYVYQENGQKKELPVAEIFNLKNFSR